MAQTNEKPICEVSEYYGDNVFMLVSRVNKALRRAGQEEKAEEWNREYKEQPDYTFGRKKDQKERPDGQKESHHGDRQGSRGIFCPLLSW